MTSAASSGRRRGQPLVVFLAIALGWIGLRAAFWEAPADSDPAHARTGPSAVRGAMGEARSDALPTTGLALDSSPLPTHGTATSIAPYVFAPDPVRRAYGAASVAGEAARQNDATIDAGTGIENRTDIASRPAPGNFLAEPGVPQATAAPLAERAAKRWHVDGWYAWRPGSALSRVAAGGPMAPAYGGTQGGVLLRYDLGTGRMRPQVFLRAVHAPARPSQGDIAIGAGLRPLTRVPLRIQGEARATISGGTTSIRPAVTALTEIAPIDLPAGFRLETYGQAGWVGGTEATAFVDGQARIDRRLAGIGPAEVRLGAGTWGGAQKYADRIDVGPSVTVDLRDAGVPARISVDYRIRVSGSARPDDGVAVTLLTGF